MIVLYFYFFNFCLLTAFIDISSSEARIKSFTKRTNNKQTQWFPPTLRKLPLVSKTCYNYFDYGKNSYVGTLSKTKSGKTCHEWAKHDAKYNAGEENYCRNLVGNWYKPWCYTTSSDATWEDCDVPECFEHTILSKSYYCSQMVKFVSCGQSSTVDNYKCEFAMDSEVSSLACFKKISHTDKEINAWWLGTLEKQTYVSHVWIATQSDSVPYDRLKNFLIILDGEKVCNEHKSETAVQVSGFPCFGLSQSIKIQLKGSNSLTLCEVLVYGQPMDYKNSQITGETVDFKSCKQSSMQMDRNDHTFAGYECELAMDKRQTICADNEFSETGNAGYSWWQGTFFKKASIKQVRIIGANCLAKAMGRLRHFTIRLDYDEICNEVKSPTDVKDKTYDCIGDTWTVKIQQAKYSEHLSLCEVIVYGKTRIPKRDTKDYKEVKFKKCYQSSKERVTQKCDKAMDGEYTDCHKDDIYNSVTKSQINPYWFGDFGKKVEIDQVRIFGGKNFESTTNFNISLNDDEACASQHSTAKPIKNKLFNCQGRSRYVTITATYATPKPLRLCEVIAYRRMDYDEILEEYKRPLPKCKPGYGSYHAPSRKCHKFIDDRGYTYSEAKKACNAARGMLYEPRNWATLNYIKFHPKLRKHCYFMGLVSGDGSTFYYESEPNLILLVSKNNTLTSAVVEPSDAIYGNGLALLHTNRLGPSVHVGTVFDIPHNGNYACYVICESNPVV